MSDLDIVGRIIFAWIVANQFKHWQGNASAGAFMFCLLFLFMPMVKEK